MWLLQHKNIHKKHLLWLKIVGMCLMFHAIVLFLVFCVYQDNSCLYALSVNKHMDYSAPIIFVPYSAEANKAPKTISKPATQKTTIQSKTPPKKIVPMIEQKKPAIIATTPPSSVKPMVVTSVAKADVKKIEQKKIDSQQVESKKVIEPVSPLHKASSFANAPTFAKASTDTSTDTSADLRKATEDKSVNKLAKALDLQQPIVPAQPIEEVKKTHAMHVPKDAHVSNNYREVEALRRGAQLQKELGQKWHPPIGVSPDCACDVSFFVNKHGSVENIKMIKSSGVIMFDISTRQALFSMKMPQWTHGKALIINFKQ